SAVTSSAADLSPSSEIAYACTSALHCRKSASNAAASSAPRPAPVVDPGDCSSEGDTNVLTTPTTPNPMNPSHVRAGGSGGLQGLLPVGAVDRERGPFVSDLPYDPEAVRH